MSTNRRIYLDFNATAPLVPAARQAMVEAMADVGNPSSVHGHGRRVRDHVERARNHVAVLVGRPREQIVFTSGGTEANWLGVHALAAEAEKRGLPRVIATTRIEHPSLRGAIDALRARGWQVVDVLADVAPGVVAAGLVNHEIGAILDAEVIGWARRHGALVHLDAVQAAGKLDLHPIDADSFAISAHKIGGPQGTGALVVATDDGLPIVDAGHQERGRRPGTENTLGIVGFGAAAALSDVEHRRSGEEEQRRGAEDAEDAEEPRKAEARDARELREARDASEGASSRTTSSATSAPSASLRSIRGASPSTAASTSASSSSLHSFRAASWQRVATLGDKLEAGLRALGARIHGDDRARVGGTINAAWPGALGESIVMALDLAGISVSTGAACTSGSIQPSAVLLGLGLSPDAAREGVRFSLGPTTQQAEIDEVIQTLPAIVERARRHR